MNENIIEHIARLAYELNAEVKYSYELDIDTPFSPHPLLVERHYVWPEGYKKVYRMTINGIMGLTYRDFEEE